MFQLLLYIGFIIFIVLLFLIELFTYIWRKYHLKLADTLSKILTTIFIPILVFFIVFSALSTVIFIFLAPNVIIISLIGRFLNLLINKLNLSQFIVNTKDLSMYISVTIILIISAYIPEKLGSFLIWILEKFSKYLIISTLYNKLITFLRLKILMYLISFILILATTLSTYVPVLGTYSVLKNLKSVIYPAFVTFLALDKFITMLKPELNKIREDIKKAIAFFTSTDNKEVNSNKSIPKK